MQFSFTAIRCVISNKVTCIKDELLFFMYPYLPKMAAAEGGAQNSFYDSILLKATKDDLKNITMRNKTDPKNTSVTSQDILDSSIGCKAVTKR